MKFLMNTGRTVRQGTFVEHKKRREYAEEVSTCFMHPVDMMVLGLDDEDHVLARGPAGMVVLRAVPSDEIARGEIFVPMGPYANHMIPAETHCSGMPDFKSTVVEIEPIDQEILPVGRVMEMSGGRRYAG